MIDAKRRDMFGDFYRLAEYYEAPPFRAGDPDHNAEWFVTATREALVPFLERHKDIRIAEQLALVLVDEANAKAVAANADMLTWEG